MKTIFAFLLFPFIALADLPSKVSELRAQGLTSALDIRVELCRPAGQIATTNLVVEAKAPAVVAWEQAVVADLSQMFLLCTNNPSNAVARTRALGSTTAILQAASAAKQVFPDRASEITRYSDRCLAHYVQYLANGGQGMIPADFGQPSKTNIVVSLAFSPSWWESEGLSSPPTVDEIIKEMQP